MSDTTREINKVTGTIIRVSWKLIVYAVVALFLYEGITRGYAFGHDIFFFVSHGLGAWGGYESDHQG